MYMPIQQCRVLLWRYNLSHNGWTGRMYHRQMFSQWNYWEDFDTLWNDYCPNSHIPPDHNTEINTNPDNSLCLQHPRYLVISVDSFSSHIAHIFRVHSLKIKAFSYWNAYLTFVLQLITFLLDDHRIHFTGNWKRNNHNSRGFIYIQQARTIYKWTNNCSYFNCFYCRN